jgi:hypothetical protein
MDSYGEGLSRNGLTEEERRLSISFEPRTFAENSKELFYESAIQARHASGLGDKPLVILTAGLPPPNPPNLLEARRLRAMQDDWIQIQGQLKRLSTAARQVVLPDSHHCIQCDRPDAIVDAVRDVVESVRSAYLPTK